MDISRYISEEARNYIRQAIEEAGGNEVFFIGKAGDERIVDEIAVLARGNETEVPAIIANCRPGDVLIHNHPSGELKPSTADNRIASLVGNDGVGFFIVNNAVNAIYVGVEPTAFEEPVEVDASTLKHFLDADGPLAAKLPQFERREPQLEMLEVVAQAFNAGKVATIEAGTGTGKTLAYLLPAIQWSLGNGKRVVISTNTINLQQQLIDKDIPLLQSIYPKPFQAVLVKGRTNYVCLRKLDEAMKQPWLLDVDGAEKELEQIYQWARKTRDGSKTDLGIRPSDRLWEHIQSESDTTLKTHCAFYKQCFFYNARRQAASADLLVANHHLLFADLAIRRASRGASEAAVLPRYERVILDEAHNLEDIASRYFGDQVTYFGILRILNRLHRIRRKDGKTLGQLPFLAARLRANARLIPRQVLEDLAPLVENKAVEEVIKCRVLLAELMDRIYFWTTAQQPNPRQEIKLRLTEQLNRDPHWQDIVKDAPRLGDQVKNLLNSVEAINRQLAKISTSFEKEARSLSVDLKAQAGRLAESVAQVERILLRPVQNHVRWIEAREGKMGRIVRLCTAPLNVATLMKDAVYERFPTVIMTSATLSVNRSFAYLNDRLGLDRLEESRRLQRILPSPFDYSKQVILCVPTDIPEPKSRDFEEKLQPHLYKAITASRGRAFALFTSYYLLRKMHAQLAATLRDLGITIYKQGEAARHVLLNRFRSDVSSVLFATDSFWEGVDVPGGALTHVIIPRLPFRVPSEPIIEARVEAIEREGRNSFTEYTVPQAIIRFKQGFGRLIRNKSDFGAITILDRRVVSKSYGRSFLASLPECQVVVGEAENVFGQLRAFLDARKG